MAGPLRGGGGKGRAIKEKKNFFLFYFFILLPFKNKNYFTLDNLSKYGHITLKFVGRHFFLVSCAILVQKLWGEKKLSKSVFGYFKTFSMSHDQGRHGCKKGEN